MEWGVIQGKKIMELQVILYRKIVDFFTSIPNIVDSGNQRALIYNAGLDAQLQKQLCFTNSSAKFFQLLIPTLVQYGSLQDGRNALEAVLESAKDFVGEDRKTYCDELLRELDSVRTEQIKPQCEIKEKELQTAENRRKETPKMHITSSNNVTLKGVSVGNKGKIINKLRKTKNIIQADDSTVIVTKKESSE